MADSIKKQIIDRMLAVLLPLKEENRVRKVERVHGLFLQETVVPALHLVIGDESVAGQDNYGYTIQFAVGFELIFSEVRDPEGKADEMAAFIQEKMESDPQLSSLADAITYDSCQPFVSEESKTPAVVVVNYVLQYRRKRANPAENY